MAMGPVGERRERIMKRNKARALQFLFAGAAICSAMAVGTLTMSANADEAANPYESLVLETGASVRYAETAAEMGFAYRLKMSKADYEQVPGNAVFGIYLAPQDYYAEHPFNSVEEIEQYYDTKNEEPESGKAKLYDYRGVMGEIAGDSENVYFRGSLLGVLDGSNGAANNLTRDFRAVGYVKYKAEGETEYTYKFVQSENEEDNIRSMAYVAEKAIAANAAAIEESSDDTEKAELTAKNAKLKEYYIDKTEDPFATPQTGDLLRIYNCADKTLELPSVAAVEAAKTNMYFKNKYTYRWSLQSGATEIEVNQGDSLNDKQGIWNLVCTATKVSDNTSKEVYSLPYQVTDLGAVTVNDEALTDPKGDVMIKNADGSYQSEYDSKTDVVQYYPHVKTGDFTLIATIMVVDKVPEATIDKQAGSGVGFVISMGAGKELVIFSNKVNQNQLIFMINTPRGGKQFTATGFTNVSNHLGVLGAGIQFKLTRKGNTLEIYNKNAFKKITIDVSGKITCKAEKDIDGTSTVLTGDTAALEAHLGKMLSAGDETAFGIYREVNYKGAYKWSLSFS